MGLLLAKHRAAVQASSIVAGHQTQSRVVTWARLVGALVAAEVAAAAAGVQEPLAFVLVVLVPAPPATCLGI